MRDLCTSVFFKFDFKDLDYTWSIAALPAPFKEPNLLCPSSLNALDRTCVEWINYSNVETSEVYVGQQGTSKV